MAACIAEVYACAAVARVWDTASGHVVQIGIGAAAGLALGAVTGGVSLLPIVAASVAASTATLLATPPCEPVVIQAPPNPIAASIQWILVGAGVWFLFRNRAHILEAIKSRTASPLLHALIGSNRS